MLGLVVHAIVLQSGSVSETSDAIVITGSGHKGEYEARGRVVRIGGNDSQITLRGPVKRIEVNGNNHVIRIDGTANAIIGGNSNRLTTTGAVASLKINGTTNQVSIGHLTRVSIGGVENVVRWKKGPNGKKPYVSVAGVDNRVFRG